MGKLADAIIGVSSALISYRFLKSALGKTEESITRLEQRRNGVPCPGSSPDRPCTYIEDAGSIERRAKMLGKLMWDGSLDPKIRIIAMKALSRKCDGRWCTPPRDHTAEISTLTREAFDRNSATRKAWRQMEGIFSYVKQNVSYRRDHWAIDTFASPKRTLEGGGEDCDGHAVLLGALAMASGYRAGFRIYTTNTSQNGEPNHIATLVELPPNSGKFVALDASVDRIRERGKTIPVRVGWSAPASMIREYRDYLVDVGGKTRRMN